MRFRYWLKIAALIKNLFGASVRFRIAILFSGRPGVLVHRELDKRLSSISTSCWRLPKDGMRKNCISSWGRRPQTPEVFKA